MKQVYEYEATVERVVDGDTVILNVDLGFKLWLHKVTCRMAKINAPEMSTPDGQQAKAGLEAIIVQHARTLRVISHGLDKYGRWVVELFTPGGACINEMMVQAGHAETYKT